VTSDNVIVQVITQTGHGFIVGNWLRTARFSEPSQPYALANSTALATSYVVGVVIQVIDANHFILQSNGYLTGSVVSGASGIVQFLDPANPGLLTPVAPTAVGYVVVPCYSPDTSSSGWIIPFRPILITNNNVNNTQIISQTGHGFVAGQWVKNVSTTGSPKTYALAQATTLVNAYLTVGMVTFVIDANTFVLQQDGYVVFDPSQLPTTPFPVVGGEYFLSPTSPGAQQTAEPANPLPSRPTFQCTLAVAATSCEGWILPQKPTVASGSSGGNGIIQSLYFYYQNPGNNYINQTTANVWQNSPLTGNITPSSVTSNIKITISLLAFVREGTANKSAGFAIGRNGSVIPGCLPVPPFPGTFVANCLNNNNSSGILLQNNRYMFSYLDSPSTTSPVSYSLMLNSTFLPTTWYLGQNSFPSAVSYDLASMCLEEVAI
jgi:hypothetical protein